MLPHNIQASAFLAYQHVLKSFTNFHVKPAMSLTTDLSKLHLILIGKEIFRKVALWMSSYKTFTLTSSCLLAAFELYSVPLLHDILLELCKGHDWWQRWWSHRSCYGSHWITLCMLLLHKYYRLLLTSCLHLWCWRQEACSNIYSTLLYNAQVCSSRNCSLGHRRRVSSHLLPGTK